MSSRLGFRLASIPLAIAATFGLGLSAANATDDNRFYIVPMGTYVSADNDRHSDDGVGGTLAFGAKLATSVEFELRGTYLSYGGKGDAKDMKVGGGGFGLNVFLKGPSGPYLHADVMGGDSTLMNVGLGWDLDFGQTFGIRAEALYHAETHSDINDDDFKEPLFNLGVRIPFGKVPEPPAPAPEVAVVPAAPPPPPPVCGDGLDNDNDGLVDFPADKGCNALDDGDETDPAPKCKPPVPGQAISLEGCGVGDVIVLRGVNFDFDKATLTVNAKTILDSVADALTSRPDIKVEIGGHTDAKGSDEYNAKLSDRRASAVKTYLTKKGITSSRMTTHGYGESMPVASNDTDEGRELNRRVELKVTESAGAVSMVPPVPAPPMSEPAPADATALPAAEPAAMPAPAPAAAASGTTVTIENYAFAPATLTVPVGTTVVWTNQDGSNHLVSFADEKSSRLKKGATYSRTFSAPGSYAYACSIHPSMTGTIVVQ